MISRKDQLASGKVKGESTDMRGAGALGIEKGASSINN